MNDRGNITLTQKSFNNLIKYLEYTKQSYVIELIEKHSIDGCYFTADFNEDTGVVEMKSIKNNQYVSYFNIATKDDKLEMSKLQDILFHAECRVE